MGEDRRLCSKCKTWVEVGQDGSCPLCGNPMPMTEKVKPKVVKPKEKKKGK